MRSSIILTLFVAALGSAVSFAATPASRSAAPATASTSAPGYTELLKIDVHSHVFEDIPELNALFRSINLRTINVCNNGTDGHLEQMHTIALDLWRKHPNLFPFEATFDLLRRDEPTYISEVIAHLDRMFAQGAVGVKIWKEIGIDIKDRNGKFILPDDPRFDPIYAHIAAKGKVLHAHLAEPIDAWRPLDPESPHYHYYSKTPEWHLYGKPEYPSHATLMAARDNILRKHPRLKVLGAHLGSLEHDLAGIDERLTRYPNFYIEVSARTRNLTRHPTEQVRALFLKHPGRILYGLDANWKPYRGPPPSPSARQGHINRLELSYRADYDYYAGQGEITYSGRQVQALHLPREVLEQFYHRNAQRLFNLPAAARSSAR